MRSKRIIEPLLVPNDNSDDKSLLYESPVNLDPNNSIVLDPLVHLNPQRESTPVLVVPTLTLVQPVPGTVVQPQLQPVTTPHFIRQTKMPTIVSKTNQA